MKNIFSFIVFFFVLSASVFAQKKESVKKGYEINIKVKGLKDSVCYLAYFYGDNQYAKDTAKLDGLGSMTFKGEESLPTGLYFVKLPSTDLYFVVKEQFFSLQTDSNDLTKHMLVKNSPENKLWFEYVNFMEEKGKVVGEINKRYEKTKDKKDSIEIKNKMIEMSNFKKNLINNNKDTFVAKFLKAMEEPEIPEPPKDAQGKVDSTFTFRYYKTHFWDNIDFSDDAILHTPTYHKKLKQYMEKLTYFIPDSINKSADIIVEKSRKNKELFKYTVWYITSTSETSKLMGTDAVFVHMVDKYYSNKQAYWLDSARLAKIVDRANTLRPLLIGKKAPDLPYLQDTLGAYKSFYPIKSKYIIQIFYDPDCGHCQKAVPKLNEIYKKIKDSKNIEVYAVNALNGAKDEEDKQKKLQTWKNFIKKHELGWINVHDAGPYYDFRKIYDITSFPVIYILNSKKEIIAKRLDVDQIEEFLDNVEKGKI